MCTKTWFSSRVVPLHLPAMPEALECEAAGQQAEKSFNAAQDTGHQFVLQKIAVDATKAEAARLYDLDATSTVKRGQNYHQTDVYPPTLRATADNLYPSPLSTLVLEKITYTNRAMILHFGTLFFMLQYLTHTSVQFYSRTQWERSIRNVNKEVRNFCIGVAFIFESHVLAFPSRDLVFQPTWATSLSGFNIPPSIYTSTNDYLGLVANWIEELLTKPNHNRACDAIRAITTIFYGIGVYTVMELFFIAGLSPFLTLYEVFSNPSRAARFLAAFYSYIARGKQDLWKTLLQPCVHDGVLAPTTEQRLRYADWLYIWAKDRTSIPHRMGELVDQFHSRLAELGKLDTVWGRDAETQLFDVFEPTFISSALASVPSLGCLIFGEAAWLAAGGKIIEQDDPLTMLYKKHNLLSRPTMLRPGFYSPLFLPHAETRGKKSSHRPTYAFHSPKEMWSITQSFPANSHWSSDPSIQARTRPKSFREILGTERESHLFKTIVKSSLGVSIGPLEYCGIGHIVHIGTSAYVAVCKGDPMIPQHHEQRAIRGLDRISSHLDTSGKRKRARSEKENKQLKKKISKLEKGYQRATPLLESTPGDPGDGKEEPKLKKRRLSADQRLALATI
ncbi:hypothetical protein B0H16DRAFT_1582755 [Mycena metata]|uniref:Uncharacterized protein n=1 Tax=Mycena metata TaxID=1033252 RepID=A0AAD7I185_9AGAR|nr:hypothetical protein B0H16DRAFT_1582755 [Mycena metata]